MGAECPCLEAAQRLERNAESIDAIGTAASAGPVYLADGSMLDGSDSARVILGAEESSC